jgi:hypothetical protein
VRERRPLESSGSESFLLGVFASGCPRWILGAAANRVVFVETGSRDTSRFSAAGPALGYLAQVDYALLFGLRRLDREDEFAMSVETLDDIVFHHGETDSATEKWQSKHSIDEQRNLTDASNELWKTLHNWIVEASSVSVRHVLLTTSYATGACSHLLAEGPRDPDTASATLERTARESENQENRTYYDAFLALDPDERQAFVASIEVIDQAAGAGAVDDELMRAVRRSATPKYRPSVVERLRGWWHGRVILQLEKVAGGEADRISSAELEERLLSIADELRDENLPIDVLDFPQPTEDEVSADDRIFVAQLRLIALHSRRLRKCIYDHNRAFAQRANWQRERLLNIGELDRYDKELIEEWERFFLPVGEDDDEFMSEDDVKRVARERFQGLDTSDLPRIRRDVRAGFIANGSLHVLADRLTIGWHPKWLEHLRDRLNEVRDTPEQAA